MNPSARIALTVPLLLTIWTSGCKKPAAAAPPPQPPPGVNIHTVSTATVPIEFREIGQTAASRRVEIRARIKGYILKRTFEEGQRVKEGQLLYTIDPREYENAVAQSAAALERAQANLDLANRDVARIAPLVKQQSLSRKELDDAETRQKVATADIAAAQADIEQAKLRLSYTQITAPVSGIIGLTLKQEGSFVDDLNNSLLTTALQTDPMYVNFSIPERSMLRYRNDVASGRIQIPAGDNWRVLIELLDGSVFEQAGKLSIIGFEVNPTTGSALFRAEVPNPDGKLIDGQFVRVRLQGAVRPDVITVPQRAVQLGDQGAFVYIVDNEGLAQIRPVKEGEWSPPNWIINSGLQPGERVIVDGIQKVIPGKPVTILPPTPASASPSSSPSTHPSPN